MSTPSPYRHGLPLVPTERGRSAAPYVERAAFATALHTAKRSSFRSPAAVAETLFADDLVTPRLLQRSATAPATTTSPGWVDVAAGNAVADFVASLAPLSAAARLIGVGMRGRLEGENPATIKIPRRQGPAVADMAWIGESAAIPTRRIALEIVDLGPPHKLAGIAMLTREVVRSASGEEVVRLALREDVAASLDASIFGTAPASALRPAGLLNGVVPIPATAGGGQDAMLADLEALAGAVADAGGSGNVVYVAAPRQAASAKLRLGSDSVATIWSSAGLPSGTVVAIEPLAFASAFGIEPAIDASIEGVVHEENVTPAHIAVPGNPNVVAAPVRSAFQTDVLLLRIILDAAWTMRAAGLVTVVNNVTWG